MNQCFPLYRGRFTILWHQLPVDGCQAEENAIVRKSLGDHYDLLVETDSHRLLAWRIQHLPPLFEHPVPGPLSPSPLSELSPLSPGPMSFKAERIQDHRLLYLDYEGPISGNRGKVTRLFGGTYFSSGILKAHAKSPDQVRNANQEERFKALRESLSRSLYLSARVADQLQWQPGEGEVGPIGLDLLDFSANDPANNHLGLLLVYQENQCMLAIPLSKVGLEIDLVCWSPGRSEGSL